MLLFYLFFFFLISATPSSGTTSVSEQPTTLILKNTQAKLEEKTSNLTLNNTNPIAPPINNHFASEGGFVETTKEIKSTTPVPEIIPEIIKLFSNNETEKTNVTINNSPALASLKDINPASLRHDSLLNNSSESTIHARKEVKFESDELSGIKPRKGVGNPPEKVLSFISNTFFSDVIF